MLYYINVVYYSMVWYGKLYYCIGAVRHRAPLLPPGPDPEGGRHRAHRTMLYYAILCYIILNYTIHCRTTLHYIIL